MKKTFLACSFLTLLGASAEAKSKTAVLRKPDSSSVYTYQCQFTRRPGTSDYYGTGSFIWAYVGETRSQDAQKLAGSCLTLDLGQWACAEAKGQDGQSMSCDKENLGKNVTYAN